MAPRDDAPRRRAVRGHRDGRRDHPVAAQPIGGTHPKIALTTGGADPLECLLHKLGIDESEFTPETGTGRINLFAGRGDADHEVTTRYADGLNQGVEFTPATSLWGTVEALRQYDMVILACEGDPHQEDKPGTARQAMLDYTSLGGRVFASHWHNVWLKKGPAPFPDTAVWDNNIEDPESPLTALVDTTLPKGQALAEWLVNVGASDVPGEIVINGAQHTVSDVTEGISTRWIVQ